ncbi:rhamnan synthesis F family protein [Acetobacter aceti]|nr:rhamnan synthesis F family protein [Acetobacter aceti]
MTMTAPDDRISALHSLISQSGLFDAVWYASRLPACERETDDLIRHFLTEGTRRQRDPGPLFNTARYLKQCWHLRPGTDNALVHYLTHGIEEGRIVEGVHDQLLHNDRQATVPTRLTAFPAPLPRIAVVVHAFYPDVLEHSIQPRLKHFGCAYSLLITTDSEEKAASIGQMIADSLPDALSFIRVTPNRGRNFGPLLSCWRNALLEHDLFLHLHTKKSLYTGSDQQEWRDTLLDTLLPTQQGVAGIVRRFMEDEALGVLQPAPGPTVPWWAWTWLTNKAAARPLLKRLNITPPDGYFDYPAGGMFWARSQALAPLLGLPWSPDDFPEESGQTDGTTAHVIERCIGLVARSTDYRLDEYDRSAGLIRVGYGRRNLDLYERQTPKDLATAIHTATTVSFDLFDTLLTRIALTPDTIHHAVADRLVRTFPQLTPSGENFLSLRKQAEHAAREALFGTDDVTLNDIYTALATQTGWPDEALALARSEEVRIDQNVLRPRPAVMDALRLARAEGKRTLLVSDTYLTRIELDPVLDRTGILPLIDEIYLSSARFARKDRGDMWDLLRATEQTDTLLHIGDNEQADIQRTADLRIRHHHVLSGLNMLRLSPLASHVFDCLSSPPGTSPRHAEQRRLAGDILLGPLVSNLFASPFLDPGTPGSHAASLTTPITLTAPETVGRVLLGPLLTTFLARLALHPALAGLEHLHFLSREGHFLCRLYTHLREHWLPHLPEASVFPVSRRVAISAAQAVRFDPEILFHSGDGYRGSMADLLAARLGVIVPDNDSLHDLIVSLPEDRATTRNLTRLLRDAILQQAHTSRNELLAWAASQGIEATAEIRRGVVDVGYGGTIQRHLQTALNGPFTGFYMAAEPDMRRVEKTGGLAFGLLANDEQAGAFRQEASIFLESILTAPHGQVTGYDTSVSPPQPRFAAAGLSQQNFMVLTRIINGAEEYLSDLLESYGPCVLHALQHGAAASLAPLTALRSGAIRLSPAVSDVLFTEDAFCGRGEIRAMDECLPDRTEKISEK